MLQTQRIQISVNFRRPYYKSWWPQVVFQPQGWNTLVNVYFLHHLLRLLCLRVMTSVSLQWCKQSAEMGFDCSDVWKCPVGFWNDSVSLKKKNQISATRLQCERVVALFPACHSLFGHAAFWQLRSAHSCGNTVLPTEEESAAQCPPRFVRGSADDGLRVTAKNEIIGDRRWEIRWCNSKISNWEWCGEQAEI